MFRIYLRVIRLTKLINLLAYTKTNTSYLFKLLNAQRSLNDSLETIDNNLIVYFTILYCIIIT